MVDNLSAKTILCGEPNLTHTFAPTPCIFDPSCATEIRYAKYAVEIHNCLEIIMSDDDSVKSLVMN